MVTAPMLAIVLTSSGIGSETGRAGARHVRSRDLEPVTPSDFLPVPGTNP
jgi:hypothetical protein